MLSRREGVVWKRDGKDSFQSCAARPGCPAPVSLDFDDTNNYVQRNASGGTWAPTELRQGCSRRRDCLACQLDKRLVVRGSRGALHTAAHTADDFPPDFLRQHGQIGSFFWKAGGRRVTGGKGEEGKEESKVREKEKKIPFLLFGPNILHSLPRPAYRFASMMVMMA